VFPKLVPTALNKKTSTVIEHFGNNHDKEILNAESGRCKQTTIETSAEEAKEKNLPVAVTTLRIWRPSLSPT
jgi:hypothetical protein